MFCLILILHVTLYCILYNTFVFAHIQQFSVRSTNVLDYSFA